MTGTIKRWTVLAAVAGFIALPGTAAAQVPFPDGSGADLGFARNLVATGPEVFVQYLGYSADYNDVTYLYYGGVLYPLFNNHSSPVGTVFRLNDVIEAATSNPFTFDKWDRLVFAAHVESTTTRWAHAADQNQWYFTDDPSSNPDGLDHAKLATYAGIGWYAPPVGSLTGAAGTRTFDRQLGFEDLYGGGDRDYNDVVFAAEGVGVVPEPSSILLLATGLLGLLGFAALKRRRRSEARV